MRWNANLRPDDRLAPCDAHAAKQHRLGVEAVRALQEDIVPLLTVQGVDLTLHGAAVAALLTAGGEN